MLRKLTYFLTTSVIKAKGIKRIFSEDPIDFKALRKDNVYQPKGGFYAKHSKRFTVERTIITAVSMSDKPNGLVIYLHGGAFISGPAQHHWDSIKTMAQQSNKLFWMCDYPKAPEHQIEVMMDNIKSIYKRAIESYSPNEITLMGDSAGATLCLLLIQSLMETHQGLPTKIIAISPVVDASLSNPAIDAIEPNDIMLSKKGVISAKRLCSIETSLQHQTISPLFGSLSGFPSCSFYLATHDITYPDAFEFAKILKEKNADITIHIGEKMPHIWPLLPVMIDAKEALQTIIKEIK